MPTISGPAKLGAGVGASSSKGFAYIPSAAGAPTGVPTQRSGYTAIYYDTNNNKFYAYDHDSEYGGWKQVALSD